MEPRDIGVVKQVWGPFFSLLITFSVMADRQDSNALLWDTNFFENSDRVDPNTVQAKAIVRVISNFGRCTGFFVRNQDNRLYIGTHRHCAAYALGNACTSGELKVETPDGVHIGTCSRLILASYKSDFAIFEATFENEAALREEIQFLYLSRRVPPLCTPLAMLGFPADRTTDSHQGRDGRFTLSRNCWVTNSSGLLNGSRVPEDVREASRREYERRTGLADEYMRLNGLVQTRYGAYHNCDIYGGNSGGPMFYAGTSVVAGLPSGFWPGLFEEQPSTASLTIETIHAVMAIPELAEQATAAKIVFELPPTYRNSQCQSQMNSRRDI